MCNHGVPFAQILRKKRQNLCRQSRTFNVTMSHRFFLWKLLLALEGCAWRFFLHCFCMSIAPRNHPPTLEIITPQPWGSLPPNHEDYPPTMRISPQPWGLPPNLEDYPPTLRMTPQPWRSATLPSPPRNYTKFDLGRKKIIEICDRSLPTPSLY